MNGFVSVMRTHHSRDAKKQGQMRTAQGSVMVQFQRGFVSGHRFSDAANRCQTGTASAADACQHKASG
jgi:hypothetical protein